MIGVEQIDMFFSRFRKRFFESDKASGTLDRVGAAASFLCAIHCAVMPMVITLMPLMALSILASEAVEWILFGISAILATGSICWGYKKHRSRTILAILACALALLSAGRILHQYHSHLAPPAAQAKTITAPQAQEESHGLDLYTIFLVSGGMIVAASHVANYRLCKRCKKCADHHD